MIDLLVYRDNGGDEVKIRAEQGRVDAQMRLVTDRYTGEENYPYAQVSFKDYMRGMRMLILAGRCHIGDEQGIDFEAKEDQVYATVRGKNGTAGKSISEIRLQQLVENAFRGRTILDFKEGRRTLQVRAKEDIVEIDYCQPFEADDQSQDSYIHTVVPMSDYVAFVCDLIREGHAHYHQGNNSIDARIAKDGFILGIGGNGSATPISMFGAHIPLGIDSLVDYICKKIE